MLGLRKLWPYQFGKPPWRCWRNDICLLGRWLGLLTVFLGCDGKMSFECCPILVGDAFPFTACIAKDTGVADEEENVV
jgi:hypothetical protein